jgi:hypothetical protein
MIDVVIDLYTNIVYSGAADGVVDWLLSVPDEAGRKIIVGKTKEPLNVDVYLSTRTISVDGKRVRMIHPADK